MAVEVQVPALGESVLEATVGRWLKKEGDAVAVGDPLVELETEKVAVEVAAEAPGVLERIERREGETVHVGDVLAVLANGDRAAAPPVARVAARAGTDTPPSSRAAAPPAPSAPTDGGNEPGTAPPKIAPTDRSSAPPAAPGERAPTAPSARRLAAEQGVDLARVAGTGPGGQITRQDVIKQAPRLQTAPTAGQPAGEEVAEARPSAVPPLAVPSVAPTGSARPEERVRLSRRRLTIARRLVEAQQTAAILTTFNEVDMTAVMALRQRRRDAFKEKHGVGLGFMSFFTKAAVGALKTFPQVNAELRDGELILKRYYDIGIAVGAEEGLVVPIVRDADRKSFAELEREIAELALKARENRLTLDELIGGTFTLTNGGVFGSLLSTPILNPPQVGILGMHKIQERPIAVHGQVEVRPMMYLALSYDHRVVDGREAVQFLVRVKELIEDPETLLLEG
jgi:2-oxoglutarate dehydrogenase E2 component (dihydrolipoamide succinyltransferase)